MGLFSSIGDFVRDATPFLLGGATVYDAYQQNKNRDKTTQIARDAIQRDYDNYVANYNYTKDYNQQLQAAQAANAAARAGAAAATDRNRRAAEKKALGIKKKTAQQMMDIYRPYLETGQRVLPQMEQAYSTGLQGLQNLNTNPRQTDLLLPSYLMGR